jgi:thiol-disulfide isomerase/thioredoxin
MAGDKQLRLEAAMRNAAIASALFCAMIFAIPATAQQGAGPKNPKAQKTYRNALAFARRHMDEQALEGFKKADKQDGGQCGTCQAAIVQYAIELQDWNAARQAAQEEVSQAKDKRDLALAHYDVAQVLFEQALVKHREGMFIQAHEQCAAAIGAITNFPDAWFLDGRALAELKSDDAAKAEFAQYLKIAPANDLDRGRARRYLSNIELARERMAPAFAVTTMDGQRVSLDELHGKVVLLDFWATWCAPCREALPNIKEIAQKFQGQPLVILSVSLDNDPQQWKKFVEKNKMTWPQYFDGGFTGPISRLFGVREIPHTFTIDADGVMRDEHIGDASIEGRLKKLVAQAETEQTKQVAAQ